MRDVNELTPRLRQAHHGSSLAYVTAAVSGNQQRPALGLMKCDVPHPGIAVSELPPRTPTTQDHGGLRGAPATRVASPERQ